MAELLRPALMRANVKDERDVQFCLDAVLSRESAGSTASGRIALPHGRCNKVNRVIAALGVNRDGIFGAGDVQIMLAFISPQEGAVQHLHFLSAAAKLFRDPENVERLVGAQDAEGLLGAIGLRG